MRIFISSTLRDLENERKQLDEALRHGPGHPALMEYFCARPEDPLTVCLQEVARSHLLVLIIGDRYGSIEPTVGISFTHAEYRKARQCDIPVLAFILQPPESTSADGHAAELDAFKREVKALVTCACEVSRADLSSRILAALWRFREEQGDGGGRFSAFQRPETYFEPQLTASNLLHHIHAFVGREERVRKILESLATDDSIVVLQGPGGSGKSRLLYEVCQRWTAEDSSPPIRILRNFASFTQETIRSLPQGRILLIVDDAHRVTGLGGLIAGVAVQNRGSSFLLTVRPEGQRTLEHELRGLQVRWLDKLEPLDEQDAKELAKRVLQTNDDITALRLVSVADGSPLIITVGGSLMRNQQVPPELLDRAPEFVRLALRTLEAALPPMLGSEQTRGRLLATLAGLSPVRVRAQQELLELAQFLQVAESEVAKAIDQLEDHGVLLRRGELARIIPDVLADHLLFDQAVDNRGGSTGFIDELVKRFAGSSLAEILRNAAELEWRSRAEGRAVDVLDQTWGAIRKALPGMAYTRRIELLDQLRPVGILAPVPVLEIVKWLLDNPRALPDEVGTLGLGQEAVVRAAPAVLHSVAHDGDFAERVATELIRITSTEARDTNPHPEHPVRVLEQIVGYSRFHPLETQLGAIRALEDACQRGALTASRWCIASIVARALARECEFGWSERETIHLAAIGLDPDRVQPVRTRALKLLDQLAMGADIREAATAVGAIATLIHPPHGPFGRAVSEAELARWYPEASVAANLLGRIRTSAHSEVVRYLAWRQLYEYDTRWWPALAEEINRLRVEPEEAGFDMFCALSEPLRHGILVGDPRQRLQRHETLLDEVAGRWWSETPLSEILTRVQCCVDALVNAMTLGTPSPRTVYRGAWLLLGKLATRKPEEIGALLRAVAGMTGPLLVDGLHGIVGAAVGLGRRDEVGAFLADCLRTGSDELRRAAALGVGYLLDQASPQDLDLVRMLLRDAVPQVRRLGIDCVRGLALRDGASARALITESLAGMRPEDIALVFRALAARADDLDDDEVDLFVQAMSRCPTLDDRAVHDFLSVAVARRPSTVVRMLLDRIRAAAAPGAGLESQHALPYSSRQFDLSAIAQSPDHAMLLRLVRDELPLEEHPGSMMRVWLPLLYRLIGGGSASGLAVLQEWIDSGESQKVVGAAWLVGAHELDFVLNEASFVAYLIEHAGRISDVCQKEVVSVLANMNPLREVATDLVSVFARLADRAADTVEQFPPTHPAHEFYKVLAQGLRTQADYWRNR